MTARAFSVKNGLTVGNSTINVVANSTFLVLSSNLQVNATHFQVGNATVNCVINSSSFALNGASTSSGFDLLNSGTVSAAAALDIVLTSFTAYRAFRFVITSILPTVSCEIMMLTSTNGGSSYDTTAGSYGYVLYSCAAGGTRSDGGDNGADYMRLMDGNIGTASAEAGNFIIDLFQPTNTSFRTRITSIGVAADSLTFTGAAHRRNAAADVDAVRFIFETGNIASCKWAVYGYK